jgi:hypothetical protein
MSTAALQPLRALEVSGSPALRLLPTTVPPGPVGPVRPTLRVLEGGRAPSRLARQAQLRRRRTVALALLAALAVAVVLLVGAVSTRLAGGGHPSTAVGAPSPTPAAATGAAGVAAASSSRIVQPGDTLWSIAAELAPGADLRPIVDELIARNGDGPLEVGTRLELP